MKSSTLLYFALAAATSSPAFAVSLDESIANTPEALSASKNYDSLFTNDDGRVTIVGPKFSSANNETLWLGYRSNPSGVCALFGFGAAVESGLITGQHIHRTAVIDWKGRFAAFATKYDHLYNERIISIMCETGIAPLPSIRLARSPIQNDDGSYTILAPSFGHPDGNILWISNKSDLKGVCQLYGFNSAIPASLVAGDHIHRTVVIGADSKFQSFRDVSTTSYNARIRSLICTR